MPWGAVIGAVGAIGSAALASDTASQNRDAASAAGQAQVNASAPYQLGNFNGSTISYGSGRDVSTYLDPTLSNLQQGFFGGAGSMLGQVGSLSQTGGINPLLAGALSQYYNSIPNASQPGQQQLANNYLNGGGIQGGLGSLFGQGAAGALGQLGSFNPTSAGSGYANLLAQQSAPGNALAANNLAQQLFNTGNLGSTGGANQMAALQQSQGATWAAQQAAGQQLGLQQQQTLGNLAGLFGGNANSLLGTGFQQGFNLNSNLYSQQQAQSQQGFQNALGLNSSGNQNLATYLSGTGNLFGQGMDINSYLQNLVQLGSNLGAARAGTGVAGANTALQGQLAANNTNGAVMQGLLGSLSNANWGSLFTGTGSNNYNISTGAGIQAGNPGYDQGMTGQGPYAWA